MTDDNLKSIFKFLITLKPVKHEFDNFEPAEVLPTLQTEAWIWSDELIRLQRTGSVCQLRTETLHQQ